MKKTIIDAITLRNIMSFSILLIIGLSALGFYFAQNDLIKLSDEVKILSASPANSSGNTKLQIKQYQSFIDSHKTDSEKANSLFISEQDYSRQINNNLASFATKTGINIIKYDYTQPTGKFADTTTVGGATRIYATITIDNPVKFTNLMRFLNFIENSIPKMQVTSLNISPDGGEYVTTSSITIEMYNNTNRTTQ